MFDIGIDIGSTATKVAVIEGARESDGENGTSGEPSIAHTWICPTGFSSVDAADRVREHLDSIGALADAHAVVATGYGRVAVPFADKSITEITCHGKGAALLFGPDGVTIDVGGQDTKVIQLAGGAVKKFVMNDKCAAGTGRFLEIMADRLAVSQSDLADLARGARPASISSMCTVFAESEVISLIGRGEPREEIAAGVIESVVGRVATLASGMAADRYFLTGGLCDNEYIVQRLAARLEKPVATEPRARFAGAIGAALAARDLKKKKK